MLTLIENIKTLGMAFLIVLMMQLPLGKQNLEQVTLSYIHNSKVGQYLHTVAAGASLFIVNSYQWTKEASLDIWQENFSKSKDAQNAQR